MSLSGKKRRNARPGAGLPTHISQTEKLPLGKPSSVQVRPFFKSLFFVSFPVASHVVLGCLEHYVVVERD
jgi:hypothetical protein